MAEIELTKGYKAIVDDELLLELTRYKWHFHSLGYAASSVGGRKDKRSVLMHRLITNASKGTVVDHINGDKLDNRRSNLRVTNQTANIGNARIRKDNSTGYKGVTNAESSGRWIARIYYKKKHIHLGSFENKHDAARMYNFWARDLFGEHARINIIREESNDDKRN